MKKLAFLYTLFLGIALNSFGQTTPPNGYIPTYAPPSPEASALGKYVDHPVSTFTGVPSINIPLMEIKSGRITVPISLSYHGSGVKVDEIASRAGTGWVLNAGGVITRTVRGLPDNATNWGNPNAFPLKDWTSNGLGYFYRDTSNLSLEFVQNSSSQPLINDLSPDAYFYNFGNKAGKIFFANATTPYALNRDPIKISGPFQLFNQFIITTEDGLIYTFLAAEGTGTGSTAYAVQFTSSWFLSRIDDPVTGKNVQFVYRTDMPGSLGYTVLPYEGTYLGCSAGGGGNPTSTGVYYPQVLKKIIYDEGYIEFKADYNRTDLTGDRAYTQINQYINQDTTQVFKKGFNLSFYTSSNGSAQENKRLYLDSVTEKGADGSLLPPYVFTYKNRDQLPERLSYQQDVWGLYNASSSTNSIYVHTYNDGSGRDFLPFDDPTNPSTNVISGIDRSSNSSVADYGTLSKIVYPTKGYTLYNYELNTFDQYTGGGLRIKSITDYSASGQPLLLKTYAYAGGFLGGPYPEIAFPESSGYIQTFWTNQAALGASEGNYVGYASVSVTEASPNGSANNNGTTVYNYTIDKDVQGTFNVIWNNCTDLSNLTTIRSRTLFPYFNWESREDRRGLLRSETILDNQGHSVKGTYYTYSLIPGPSFTMNSSYPVYDNYAPQAALVTDLRGTYNINVEKEVLSAKTEILYGIPSGGGTSQRLITNTQYTYTGSPYDGAFIRSETKAASNDPTNRDEPTFNENTATYYTYPFDYDTHASGGTMDQMTRGMHYINPVISKVETRTSAHYGTLKTSAQINNYQHNPYYSSGTYPNSIVPSQVYILNTLLRDTSTIWSNFGVADPSNPGSLFEKRLQYLNFDGQADALSLINLNNPVVNYIWSYNGKYPIAQITNADYSSIVTALGGQTAIETFRDIPDPTNAAVNTFLAPLRNRSLFPNAQVITYTYKPLAGVTSITDARGYTTSYEYDSFQRLVNVRDQYGNIKTHYCYNYAGQSVDCVVTAAAPPAN